VFTLCHFEPLEVEGHAMLSRTAPCVATQHGAMTSHGTTLVSQGNAVVNMVTMQQYSL
jgi:hypothetical protein